MALRRPLALRGPATALSPVLLSLLLVAAAPPANAAPAAPPANAAPATRPANAAPAAPRATAVPAAPPANAHATTGPRPVDVPGSDGIVLKASLIAPTGAGPHPALVFISSWGLNDAQYLVQSRAFAGAGYVVLAYTARGFWGSGGEIDTAGPRDVADVTAVVDWLLGNADVDAGRIGVAGVSYGAGIGLIAAGHDPRVRAVVAMSGWTDLVESLYGYQTRRPQAVWLLRITADLLGRPSAEFDRIAEDYFADRNVPDLVDWGQRRSARTYLRQLNASAPALLLANAYGDSLFPPNQLVDFFEAYDGPKRLEFAPGDHAIAELTGLAGLPNHVWTSARRWFDEHLRALDTGITDEPVVLRVRNAGRLIESYVDWPDVTGSTVRYGLGAADWLTGAGELSTAPPATGWAETISATGNTVADAGVVLISNGLEALTGEPPRAWLPAVSRVRGAVWTSPPLSAGAQVRGIPRLRLTVTPGAAAGTLMIYMYDVDAFGTGRLVTHSPVGWSGARVGAPLARDVALPATAWNVPSGHRLALVVDTEDPLYLDANRHGSTVDVGGPSWLDLPLR